MNQIATVARASCGFDDAGTADLERLWSRDEIARPVHREWQRDQSNVRCKSLETQYLCFLYLFMVSKPQLWSGKKRDFDIKQSYARRSDRYTPAWSVSASCSEPLKFPVQKMSCLLGMKSNVSYVSKCQACLMHGSSEEKTIELPTALRFFW